MTSVVFYFQVPQPYRLQRYTYFDIGGERDYFTEPENKRIVERVADRCYLPMNKLILEAIEETRGRLNLEMLARAFEYSQQAHHGQTRKSGEKYITHCVEVGKILADLYLDTASICAAFLHDVVEDTSVDVDEVRAWLEEQGLLDDLRYRFK